LGNFVLLYCNAESGANGASHYWQIVLENGDEERRAKECSLPLYVLVFCERIHIAGNGFKVGR
jgi:hypothetical protein